MNEELEFTKNGFLEENIAKHRKYNIEKRKNQFICLIVGNTGTGKTATSLMLEHYIKQGDVNLDTVCMSHDKFIKEYTTKPKRKVIVYEEGRNSFDKNKYSHNEVKEARDKINQYRKFYHTLFINFQNPHHLTSEIVRNADALIRKPSSNHKSISHYYNAQSIRKMWKKNDFQGWEKYDARDFTPSPENVIPEIWDKYQQQADEQLEREEIKQDNEDNASELNLFKVANAAEKLDLHPDTVRDWCREGKINSKKISGMYRIPEKELKRLLDD